MKLLRRGMFLGIGLAGLAIVFGPGGSALAQGTQRGASRVDTLIEEITVTARKREETVHDTPISVSAFTGESLELRGITDIDSLQNITPNLTFINSSAFIGGANSATVFLRGIGQADFAPTTEPGVGIYVDGVYFGRTVGSVLNLVDFERVEVLRGPQGTLFGRNTIGGAINITSTKPTADFQFNAEATVGTDDRIDAKGTVNGKLLENLFGRLTFATYNQNGFIENILTGQDYGDEDEIAGRAALRWVPTDNFEVNFAFDYSSDRENGRPTVYGGAVHLPPPFGGPTGNFTYTHNVFLGSGPIGFGINGCDASPANPDGSLDNPDCVNDQWLGLAAGEGDYYSNVDTYGTNLTFDWDVLDNVHLRSITAYRRIQAHTDRDNDNTPLFITSKIEDRLKHDQWTQEVQLLGTLFEERLEWILGFFYFQEDGKNPNPVAFTPVTLISGGLFDNDSIAGFAQFTWHITDRLHLTPGIRYTKDTKRFTPDQYITEDRTGNPLFAVGTRTLPFVEAKIKADDWTPAVSLSFDWNDELMTYVSYSEGFKGGGFHQRVFPPIIPGITAPPVSDPADVIPRFDPEFVKSYEGGFKFTGFNGRFRLNGAGFYTDYSDLQITILTGVAPVLDNAGDATIAGFELESQWVPLESWFVEFSAGYMDASYDSVDPTTGLTGDEKLAWVPDWTLGGSVTKEFVLPNDWGTLAPRIDWSYRSKIWFDAVNTLDSFQEGYGLVNGSVAWDSLDGHYSVVFGMNNIADEDYLQMRRIQLPFGTFENLLGRDFEWYLTLKFRY